MVAAPADPVQAHVYPRNVMLRRPSLLTTHTRVHIRPCIMLSAASFTSTQLRAVLPRWMRSLALTAASIATMQQMSLQPGGNEISTWRDDRPAWSLGPRLRADSSLFAAHDTGPWSKGREHLDRRAAALSTARSFWTPRLLARTTTLTCSSTHASTVRACQTTSSERIDASTDNRGAPPNWVKANVVPYSFVPALGAGRSSTDGATRVARPRSVSAAARRLVSGTATRTDSSVATIPGVVPRSPASCIAGCSRRGSRVPSWHCP